MIFQKIQIPSALSYVIAQFLFGETPKEGDPPADKEGEKKTTPPPEEKMIPESEWKRMLGDERKRMADETRAAVLKEAETKIVSEETLKELGFKSVEELLADVKKTKESGDDDKKGKKSKEADRARTSGLLEEGKAKPEEIQALESRFQTEVEQRDKEIEKQTKEAETLKAELELERIDNALKYELERLRASSSDLIAMGLRQFVKMDNDRKPMVVNEQGEPRVKTVEYTEDGVKRFRTDDMAIGDLVEEFLQKEENQHFLPASPKEGSGAGGILPPNEKVAKQTQYNTLKEELAKTGEITPEFHRLQRELYAQN